MFESPNFIQNCCNLKFNRFLKGRISIPESHGLRLNFIFKIKTANKKNAHTLAFNPTLCHSVILVNIQSILLGTKNFTRTVNAKSLTENFSSYIGVVFGLDWQVLVVFFYRQRLQQKQNASVVDLHKSHQLK